MLFTKHAFKSHSARVVAVTIFIHSVSVQYY